MFVEPNNLSNNEGLTRIKNGEILILQGNESTGTIVQHASHAELVTPGSAIGGSFDRDVTNVYSIGDVTFSAPTNPNQRQKAIQHRQADIDRMLQIWKEKDPLERTVSLLKMLCHRFGFNPVRDIPTDLLVSLTGTNVDTIDRAWNRLLSIDITDSVISPARMEDAPAPLLELDTPSEPHPGNLSFNFQDGDRFSDLTVYSSLLIVHPEQTQTKQRRRIPKLPLIAGLGSLALAGVGASFYVASRQLSLKPNTIPADRVVIPAKQEEKPVSALGYIEPEGEIIHLSAPAVMEGSRVDKLFVRQGDSVKKGGMVAVLDNRERLQTVLEQTRQSVQIAEAKLQQVKAGSKTGDIRAQEAKYQQTKAELEGQINAQQAAISNLQAQLEGERSTQEALILQVEAELSNADKECARYKMLEGGGAVSKSQRDNICLSQTTTQKRLDQATTSLTRIVNTREKQIREAQANLQRTVKTLEQQIAGASATKDAVAEVRPVDVRVANQELQSAKAAVKKAEADLALAYVRSPIDAQILKIHTFPGEMVNRDKGIAELGQTKQMYVTANIYETDIARVKKGQKATLTADGVVGSLTGYVERIGLKVGTPDTLGTDPVREADARVVEVKIRLTPKDSKKVKNLTNLQVNVIINPS